MNFLESLLPRNKSDELQKISPNKNIHLVCKQNFTYQKNILWDIYLGRGYMNFLPPEILPEIFKFLEPNPSIPRVCKKFYKAYQNIFLWNIYLFRDYKIQDENPKETYVKYYKFLKLQKWLEKHDEKYTLEELENLKKLDLSSTFAIKSLPKEIENLTKLETFYLEGNNLKSLPREIGKLTNLKKLVLGNGCIESLPKEIGNLKKLKKLGLWNNNLESLPKEIGNLEDIEIIDLDDNDLKSLPKEIGNLKNLKTLYLENNKIKNLPKEIKNVKIYM